MSIKSFVKGHCPGFLLQVLRLPYRVCRKVKKIYVCSQIEKFRPYYQDELSLKNLDDMLIFLRTGRRNQFILRAAQEGWKYTQLKGWDELMKDFKGDFSADKYSGYVILEHDDEDLAEYTRNLLTLYGVQDKFRLMKLRDFMNGEKVNISELVIAAVKSKNFPSIKEYARKNNLECDITGFIFGKHEEIQYLDVFKPADDEIVIDAGCFDGMTALRFLEWGGDKIKHIYSFELDPANFKICEKNLKAHDDKIKLVKKGTWDKEEIAYINDNSEGTSSSRASEKGTVKAFMTPIDSIVKDEKVTFIKMDVEGAELKSLIGAKNTIIKNKPRLAICAYHKFEDLYELPKYILSLVPEYKFLLRRYDSHQGETVLYAYCE